MKLLLTGGTGFIGGRVASLLVDAGHELRCLVRKTSHIDGLRELGVEFSYGDVTDRASLVPAVSGIDGVLHLAAWYEFGIRDKEKMRQINVVGTENILDAARSAEVSRVLHCSSIVALGPTLDRVSDEGSVHPGYFASEYERTKNEAHAVANRYREEGLPLMIVMPGAVYGPGDTSMIGQMLGAHLDGLTPVMICPDSKMSYVHVDDVARGIVAAFEKFESGQDYLLVGDVKSVEEIYELLEKLMKIKKPKIGFSGFVGRIVVHLEVFRARVVGGNPLINMEGYEMLASGDWAYTSRKARELLGWTTVGFEEGLKSCVDDLYVARGLPKP